MRERLIVVGGLVLRPWTLTDNAAVLEAFGAPQMERQAAEPVTTPEAAERWLSGRVGGWEAGTAYAWAVTDDADVVLGNVMVSAIDRRHDTGWVSYWTTGRARGRGVATAGCRGLARWAFEDLGLFRLELGHRTDNPASCGVATGAGFLAEGIERAKLRYGAERYDTELHARLATDPDPDSEG